MIDHATEIHKRTDDIFESDAGHQAGLEAEMPKEQERFNQALNTVPHTPHGV
ncbi:MAG: hypothetical protein ACTJLL_04665 [Anaplasma sp.]